MKLSPFALERYFAEHEFSTPHLLCSSDLESMSLAELCALEDGSMDQLGALWLGYTEPQGDPELRDEIAELYGKATAEDIIVHAGGVEAIFTAVNAMVEAGDRVIVQVPGYQCLHEVARGLGAEIVPWHLRAEDSWQPDLELLESLLRAGARAVVVNFPHNPTGTTPSPERWRELVDRVSSHGAFLFSDEAYRFSEYRPEDELPPACDLHENAVSMGLLSKAFGLPGLRIAWLATRNRRVREKVSTLKDYTTICSSAPSELLARIALRHRDVILGPNLALERSNLELLRDFLHRWSHHFECAPPLAGPICFPRWLGSGTADDLSREALEAGVMLLPGSVFDIEDHFRMGFGRRGFPQALAAFESFLESR